MEGRRGEVARGGRGRSDERVGLVAQHGDESVRDGVLGLVGVGVDGRQGAALGVRLGLLVKRKRVGLSRGNLHGETGRGKEGEGGGGEGDGGIQAESGPRQEQS